MWSPTSWRQKPVQQMPAYPDASRLAEARDRLQRLPPLVSPQEIERLKAELAAVARGDALLLQGGDCAELFAYCEASAVEAKLKLLLQMSLVLVWGAQKPVVRIGRMAGQYAKPRSRPTEPSTVHPGTSVPSYRGDILNGFPEDQRDLDPDRLTQAYFHAAATLNYTRSLLANGFADLHRPFDWDLGHVRDEGLRTQYAQTVQSVTDMLRFLRTIGADTAATFSTVDVYTSHEGLLLEYEEALTRLLPRPTPPGPSSNTSAEGPTSVDKASSPKEFTAYYDTSAHFLWIGDRTRQLDHAHVEFFRGIANPIGIKVGPTTPTHDLLALLRAVNPDAEAGKITLITRYGAGKVAELLPAHIEAVEGSEYRRRVVWQCDPMHGNTISTADGTKTRDFGAIVSELQTTMSIHRTLGSYLGGVHLELTGDAVTECLGGAAGLDEGDLAQNYTTFCDPRLNEKQALELAFLMAEHYRH